MLAAGKSVICEKPLATTLDGARELAAAAGDLYHQLRAADLARDLTADVSSAPTVAVWLVALLTVLGFTGAAVATWWLA